MIFERRPNIFHEQLWQEAVSQGLFKALNYKYVSLLASELAGNFDPRDCTVIATIFGTKSPTHRQRPQKAPTDNTAGTKGRIHSMTTCSCLWGWKDFFRILVLVHTLLASAAAEAEIGAVTTEGLDIKHAESSLDVFDGVHRLLGSVERFKRKKERRKNRRKNLLYWDETDYNGGFAPSTNDSNDDGDGGTVVINPVAPQFSEMLPDKESVHRISSMTFHAKVQDERGPTGKTWFEVYDEEEMVGNYRAELSEVNCYVFQINNMTEGRYSWRTVSNIGRGRQDKVQIQSEFMFFNIQLTTQEPSNEPSSLPSVSPTESLLPTSSPSIYPSASPTSSTEPSISLEPTMGDTKSPTSNPTMSPSMTPTGKPSQDPTLRPTSAPTEKVVAEYGLQPDCNTVDASRFNICLDLSSRRGKYRSWMDGFIIARNRWESIIVEDDGYPPANIAGVVQRSDIATKLPRKVDDVYIAAAEEKIDGRGGILGMAGPTAQKLYNGRYVTVGGIMKFDSADINYMLSLGTWPNFIEHEMGHVLGFGTMFSSNGIHTGLTEDDVYKGKYAREEWERLGCSGDLPIETDGGIGTAGGHWDEQCLQDEIMTGWADDRMYLSRLTIAAFKDLGFGVNMDAADEFTIDQLGKCGSYCPEAGRKLRGTIPKQRKLRKRISDEGREKVLQIAATVLTEQRRVVNMETSKLEGVLETVPGTYLTVLIQDSDNEIKEETVTWDDILAMAETTDSAQDDY